MIDESNLKPNKMWQNKVECKNAYPGTIKMKHVDIKSSLYIDFNEKIIKKVFKFKISDYMRDMFQIGKIFFVINTFQKINHRDFKIEKLIKSDKLNVKLNGYDTYSTKIICYLFHLKTE